MSDFCLRVLDWLFVVIVSAMTAVLITLTFVWAVIYAPFDWSKDWIRSRPLARYKEDEIDLANQIGAKSTDFFPEK